MAVSGVGSTAIGTSLFQQTNKKLAELAASKISRTTQQTMANMSAERLGKGQLSQVSEQTVQLGQQATRTAMQEIKEVTGSSNFGNSTNVGRSVFQQANEQLAQLAARTISRTTQQTMANISTDRLGKGQLSQVSEQTVQLGQQATRTAMQEIKEVTGSSNFGNSTKIGTSDFQKANERVVQEGARSISHAMQQVKAAYKGAGNAKVSGNNIDMVA